ncbi:MAG: hypothetical protein AUG47_00045 [Alphaproteobacteria bacterium 13_1_20CM_3_64_12]|nr:MAG: hypothetical protein AUG47_00045 [Alphaproteobacteria bacterium 13_1_20CM_3_64_12]
MLRHSFIVLAVVACLSATRAAPLSAQAQQPSSPARAAARAQVPAPTAGGPRLSAGFQSYQPSIGRNDADAAAAASRTTITISTLGLILIAVLLILLLT